MNPVYYPHAMWRDRAGRDAAFVVAWNQLASAFEALPSKPLWGALLQSLSEPARSYSFGPWSRLEDIEDMRRNPTAQAAMATVRSLCIEASPSACRLVTHVDVADRSHGGRDRSRRRFRRGHGEASRDLPARAR